MRKAYDKPADPGRFYPQLLKQAKLLTRWISLYYGDAMPFYHVTEYPKSGGTWLARMVADYLQLPFPRYARLPVAFPAVLLSFWSYHPRFRRVFYLYRDGRDVVTSLFFERLRALRHSKAAPSKAIRRVYEGLLGEGYQAADSLRLMPRFIEFEFRHPGRGAHQSWRDHVAGWLQARGRSGFAFLSYEQLLSDCAGTLGRALAEVTGDEVDPWRLEVAVEKFSMRRFAGREPGEEDLSQHTRKGVRGDWRNHFTREAAETFDAYAGELLVELGYESDRDWVAAYDYSEVSAGADG